MRFDPCFRPRRARAVWQLRLVRAALLLAAALAGACTSAGRRYPAQFDAVATAVARADMRRMETDKLILYYPRGRKPEALRAAARLEYCRNEMEKLSKVHTSPATDKAIFIMPEVPLNNAYVAPGIAGAEMISVLPLSNTANYFVQMGMLADPGSIGCHEMSHYMFNLQQRSLFGFFQKVFGRGSVNATTLGIDPWIQEGGAVYHETRLMGRGRLWMRYFDGLYEAGMAEEADGFYGGLLSIQHRTPVWGGQYLFGSRFIDYLARTYGEDRIWQVLYQHGSSIIPFINVSGRFEDVYGKTLSELIDEFAADFRAHHEPRTRRPDQRTLETLGREAVFARSLSGRMVAIRNDLDEPVRLTVYEPDGSELISRRLTDLLFGRRLVRPSVSYASGLSMTADGQHVYFVMGDPGPINTEMRLMHLDVRDDDLEVVQEDIGGAGGSVSADGRYYYFTKPDGDLVGLYVYDLDTHATRELARPAPRHYLDMPFASPDGTRLVVTEGSDAGIRLALYDAKTGARLFDVAGPPGPIYQANWFDDQHVVYAADDGRRLQAFVTDVTTGAYRQLTDAPYLASLPFFDGRRTYFMNRQGWRWTLDVAPALKAPPAHAVVAQPPTNESPAVAPAAGVGGSEPGAEPPAAPAPPAPDELQPSPSAAPAASEPAVQPPSAAPAAPAPAVAPGSGPAGAPPTGDAPAGDPPTGPDARRGPGHGRRLEILCRPGAGACPLRFEGASGFASRGQDASGASAGAYLAAPPLGRGLGRAFFQVADGPSVPPAEAAPAQPEAPTPAEPAPSAPAQPAAPAPAAPAQTAPAAPAQTAPAAPAQTAPAAPAQTAPAAPTQAAPASGSAPVEGASAQSEAGAASDATPTAGDTPAIGHPGDAKPVLEVAPDADPNGHHPYAFRYHRWPDDQPVHVISDSEYSIFDGFFIPQAWGPWIATREESQASYGLFMVAGDRLGLQRYALAAGYDAKSKRPAAVIDYNNIMLAPFTFEAHGEYVGRLEKDNEGLIPEPNETLLVQEVVAHAMFSRSWYASNSIGLGGTLLYTRYDLHDSGGLFRKQRFIGPSLAVAHQSAEQTAYAGDRLGVAIAGKASYYPKAWAFADFNTLDLRGELDLTTPLPLSKRHTLNLAGRVRTLSGTRLRDGLLQVGGAGADVIPLVDDAETPSGEQLDNLLPSELRFIETLRGFEDKALYGKSVVIGDATYTLPIIIDWGSASTFKYLPAFFFRQIDIDLFASTAWLIDEGRDVAAAVGGALRFKFVLWQIPLNPEFQLARRLTYDKDWAFYFRMGADL